MSMVEQPPWRGHMLTASLSAKLCPWLNNLRGVDTPLHCLSPAWTRVVEEALTYYFSLACIECVLRNVHSIFGQATACLSAVPAGSVLHNLVEPAGTVCMYIEIHITLHVADKGLPSNHTTLIDSMCTDWFQHTGY